ncbi:hypothetical protein E8E11_002611 [Didymella keratinophila]|uniref:Uncharacterized protein n=1 Tax=Didymella heteroderae TaxID=1769908 RepID=A0A9P4WFJ0_9PLEO|nr:hypothetical protein E8E12_000751 [Didymella heteroderae]KAF3032310.1 hypothetical protein E8E11_002611 [Didymella keratinophila]
MPRMHERDLQQLHHLIRMQTLQPRCALVLAGISLALFAGWMHYRAQSLETLTRAPRPNLVSSDHSKVSTFNLIHR